MLPVLFHIAIPAGWTWVVSIGLAVAIVVGRAVSFRRQSRKAGREVSWGAALWNDKAVLGALLVGIFAAWRTGVLDEGVRVPLHTYGVMLALAFVAAIWLAQKEAERQGQDPNLVGDLAFWILVSSLVGARVYFILVNWGDYFGPNAMVTTRSGRIPRLFALWEGGMVFYGGFIAAALAAAVYLRRKKMAFLPWSDTLIPSVAFGQFLGRIGCFSAGCCWGRSCDPALPWAARFPPESLAFQSMAARANPARFISPDHLHTLPIHPVQLYESLGELLLFAFLAIWLRPRKTFDGQVMAAWLMLYAVLRTTTETFRGDVERGVWMGLGAGQWTSLVIFATGAAIWIVGSRATRRAVAALPA
ncbi:MAG TPA: prolipoprotein diacylglyceryl transferase [Anaeromyxobacteraceae bacterium]|nr:prolipoprotein diacylglyceryl transferase [Anaeromyxobacteraceae bacterium]